MKIFSNKFLISFLILAVLFYSFSVKVAEAKGVISALAIIVIIVVAVIFVVATGGAGASILAAIGVTGGSATAIAIGAAAVVGIASIAIGQIVCLMGNNNPMFTGCGGDPSSGAGGGSGVNVGGSGGSSPIACWQVPVTMYIPSFNSGYSNECGAIDETQSNIALYRFSIPNSSSQSAVNDWYLDQIKTKVGDGYLVSGYHTASTNEVWMTLPYSQICTGNVCKFNDDTVPENSYVAYGAKIIGNYYKNEDGSCFWPNKFLNKDNAGTVTMPSRSVLGNAFVGPYNIGDCPPKVDLKINNSDNPQKLVYPETNAELKWTSEKVNNCAASGDWSGSKTVSGTENLGKLTRGTGTPGEGKKYNYTLSCSSIKDSSIVNDSVSAFVWKYPGCSFSANPAVIPVLPATSTLSWDCRYSGTTESSADSCSIDQGIGSVNPSNGSVSVRPTKDTTYTLTCQALDGDGNTPAQVTVGVGFKPRIKEVIPR